MDRLSTILPSVLRQRGMESEALSAHALTIARRWLDREFPTLSTQLRPATIQRGELVIVTDSSPALAHVSPHLSALLALLRSEITHLPLRAVRIERSRSAL